MTEDNNNKTPQTPASIAAALEQLNAPAEPKKRGRPKKEDPAPAIVVDDIPEISQEELMLQLMEQIPPPGEPWVIDGEAIFPGRWMFGYAQRNRLPQNCPVRPLGKDKEGCWFRDPMGGILHIAKSGGKGDLDHLFAPLNDFLFWAWPQLKPIEEEQEQENGKKKKVVVGWECDNYKAELARRDLFRAAGLKGPFDPLNKVRGRGCWPDGEGGVIYHAGDRVLYKGVWQQPDEIDGFIYSAKPAIGRPSNDPSRINAATDEMTPSAKVILDALKTWRWDREELEPMLVLGFMVSCLVCGALKVRPGLWLSGETNAGKSELFKFIRDFMMECMISIEKATAASIYQNLRDDRLAVQLDEQENSEDRRQMKSILDLMLVSFSGGKIGKGGQDGVPVNYQLFSSIFMSGIVQASMAPANENRMVSVMIRTLPPERATGFKLPKAEIQKAASDIFGRVLRDFDRLERTFATVRSHLARMGYEGRHQDTYGTLIACAHVAMFDHEMEDSAQTPLAMDLAWWEKRLPKIKAKKNWHDLYDHILDTPINAYRDSGTPNVMAIIEKAILSGQTDELDPVKWANGKLGVIGLHIIKTNVPDVPADQSEVVELFIPNRHGGLAEWLRPTMWGGGTGESGAWQGVLKQFPPNIGRKHTVKRAIYGKAVEGVYINLKEAAKAFD